MFPGSTVAIGIVQNGAGMSGTAIIAVSGTVNCAFDGATTAGDFVRTSSMHGGDCSDSATAPSAGRGLGRVLTTNATSGTYAMVLTPTGAGNWATAQIPNTPLGWSRSTRNDEFVSSLNQPLMGFQTPNQSYSAVMGIVDVPVISTTVTPNSYGAAGVYGLARSGFADTAAEAGRFEGRISNGGASAWGVRAVAESCSTDCSSGGTSSSPNLLVGGEFDVDTDTMASAMGQVTGIFIVTKSTAAPPSSTSYFDGVLVRNALCMGCQPFNYSFRSDTGASNVALLAGAITGTGASASQPIQLQGYDGTHVHTAQIQADMNGNLISATAVTAPPGGSLGACTKYTLSPSGTNWTVAVNGAVVYTLAIAASTAQAIPLLSLSAGAQIFGSILGKTTTAFSGTGFTAVTSTIGDTISGATWYTVTPYNLAAAVSNSNFDDQAAAHSMGMTWGGSAAAAVVTANQNLNAHPLAGSVDYYICSGGL